MKKEYYYVYCQGLLGVKTDLQEFKWVYGSAAPAASAEAYENCLVRFDVRFMPEKNLSEMTGCDDRFQAFAWEEKTETLYYRRNLLPGLRVGYNLSISGNVVNVQVGTLYSKLVRNRVMNLHGVYYLLADVANMMLMRNGYLTLYASAVTDRTGSCGMVFFAPPNTGKTLTATKLCTECGCRLVGEDVVITDGKKIYGCPWTSSYRKAGKIGDSAGALGRTDSAGQLPTIEESPVTDLVVLSPGKNKIINEKEDVLRRIKVLSGYLFHYFSSPIVKVLGYFEPAYACPWNACAEKLLEEMADNCICREFRAENAPAFGEMAESIVLGEEI